MTQSCNPELFWSYAAWAQGKPGHGREILLNIALFVPLGYFLAAVLDGSDVNRTKNRSYNKLVFYYVF